MNVRALLIICGLGLTLLAPGFAKDRRAQSNNPNVKSAMKKAKKVRPRKHKAPKKSRKPASAKYGVKHL